MKRKDWKAELLADAERNGICGQYMELLRRADSISDFMNIYRRGAEWALEKDCPSYELLQSLADERLDLHGVYVDKRFDGDVLASKQVYIFHHCTGTIKTGLNIRQRVTPVLYFANGCDIRIESMNEDYLAHPVRVQAYVFGDNHIEAESSKKMNCVLYYK